MQYHLSQYIQPKHETLFTSAILRSLLSPHLMLTDLPEASVFSHQLLSLHSSHPLSPLNFSQKLGHLYEEALLRLLNATDRFDVITNNHQLFNQKKQTIGELDYLLRDKTNGSFIHLELAVKFYLIVSIDQTHHYPGPDARDCYQKKVTRLREHQLTLSSLAEVQESLSSLIGHSEIIPQQMVHGIFFDHIKANDLPIPLMANKNVRRRKWLYCSEFNELFPEFSVVKVLPKQLWLCEIDEQLFQALVEVPISELIELGQQRCTMFVTNAGAEPLFLAPDRWPNIH